MFLDGIVESCVNNLSAEHKEYLLGRRISLPTIQEFSVGTFKLADILQLFDKHLLQEYGIVKRDKGGKHYFSSFDKRVVFPTNDVYGQVVAIIGRIIEHEQGDPVKYYNSIYTKSENLFNLDKAKKEIMKTQAVFIVEGNLDVMSLWEAGIRNAVGIGSSAFSDAHLRLVMRYASRILIATDNDKAGDISAAKIVDKIKFFSDKGYLKSQRVFMPRNIKDFNAYLCSYGPEETFRFASSYQNIFCDTTEREEFCLSWGQEDECQNEDPQASLTNISLEK